MIPDKHVVIAERYGAVCFCYCRFVGDGLHDLAAQLPFVHEHHSRIIGMQCAMHGKMPLLVNLQYRTAVVLLITVMF